MRENHKYINEIADTSFPWGKVVVTGATGLVGSHLVAELLRGGCREFVFPVRSAKSLSKLYAVLSRSGLTLDDAKVEVVETSLMNPVMFKQAFNGAVMVFNCAATVAIGGMDERTLVETNVGITSHVVNAALACGVEKLIHVSSVATLHASREESLPADESSILISLAGANPYAVSKVMSDNEVRRGEVQGLKTVIVKPATILGSGDSYRGSGAIIPILAKGLSFYPSGVTAFVDVEDVARGLVILSMSERAVGEQFLLSAGSFSYYELISLANEVINKRPPKHRLGYRMLSIASFTEKLTTIVSRRNQLLTKEMVDILCGKYYYTGEKIKKTVNFDYTSLEDTLIKLISRSRQNA